MSWSLGQSHNVLNKDLLFIPYRFLTTIVAR